MSEERGFEIRDRRRVRPDGETPAAGPESGAGSRFVSAEDLERALNEELLVEDGGESSGESPRMHDLLYLFCRELMLLGWVRTGLWANPASGNLEPDLAEAKKAIDLLGDLWKHLEPDLEPDERRQFQNELSNLRINFVKQSQSAG